MSIVKLFTDPEDQFTFEEGQIIFEKGDDSDFMYIILAGQVQILFNAKVLDTISVGDVFGEMALIDDAPRSATAKARTHCMVAQISQHKFHQLVKEQPEFALEVMKIMAERQRKLIEEKFA